MRKYVRWKTPVQMETVQHVCEQHEVRLFSQIRIVKMFSSLLDFVSIGREIVEVKF